MDRREFLGLSAAATLAVFLPGCSAEPQTKIPPTSPLIADLERKRAAGAAVQTVDLRAVTANVDLGGAVANTWTYGGQIPGTGIRIKRGEVLKAVLHNELPVDTVIHWHGIALRNDMDGVPGITQQSAVKAGESFTYEFAVPDSGTHWFHPHLGTQLDRGLYSALIVEDPDDGADYDSEAVVILDDWLASDPDAMLETLRRNGMGGMVHGSSDGHSSMTMPQSDVLGGDAVDVTTYRASLANGRTAASPRAMNARMGERVRLRIINAAADTAFRVGVPGQQLRVTHTDGFPVVPALGDSVLLGMGERIDAIVTVTGVTRVIALAEGRKQLAQFIIRPENMVDSADIQAMANAIGATRALTVTDFVAADSVQLASREPDVTHDVVLGGPGEGTYKWTINGLEFNHEKPFEGALNVEQGQRVRLNIRNDTTMFHPVHLHGHTFQVAKNGQTGPRKDTAIVLPKETLIADFDANNPGQWVAHCHNLYHGESGMMSIVSYVE